MRIRSFHIEGFGILHDTGVHNISPGLSIFTGDNESGKSTLNRFIRAAFFGISGKIAKDEPLRGGSYGGNMILDVDGEGTFLFELKNGKVYVTDGDGKKLSHRSAMDMFGGVDRQIYERIFAVGLEDIQHHGDSVLDQEKLRNRLFAAGAGLGEISISDVFSGLDAEMEKLAKNKSSRSKSLIKDESAKLVETERKLRALSSLKDEYSGLTEGQKALRDERDEIEHELKNLSARSADLKRLLSILEPCSRLKGVRAEIADLEEKAGTLPPGASERFAETKRNIVLYNEKLQKKSREMEDLRRDTDALAINPELSERPSELDSLRGNRGKLADMVSEIASGKEKLKHISSELAGRLAGISPEWTEDDLEKTDTSMTAGDEAAALCRDFDILDRKRIQMDLFIEKGKQELDFTLSRLTDARRVLSEFGDDDRMAEDISAEIETIKGAKASLAEIDHIHDNILVLEKSLDEYEARLAFVDSRASGIKEHRLKGPVLFILAAIPGGGTAIWYLLGENYAMAYLFCSVILSAGFLLLRKWQRDIDTKVAGDLTLERERILSGMERIRHDISAKDGSVDVLKERLLRSLSGIGCDHEPDMDELDRLISDRERDLRRAVEMDRASAKLEEIHGRFVKQSESLSALKEERVALGKELNIWRENWETFLLDRGFPEGVKPASFQLIMQSVISAEKLLSSKMELSGRIRRLSENCEAVERQVSSIMKSCGLSFAGDTSGKISFLVEQFEKNREAVARKAELDRKMEEMLIAKDELEKGEKRVRAEQLDLMKRARASSEDMFFLRIEEHSRLVELKNKEKELLAGITVLAGSECPVDEVLKDLEDIDTSALNVEADANRERIESLSSRKDKVIEELARSEMRLQEISYDGTKARLVQKRENLLAGCRENAGRWAAYAVCRWLLDRTREKYEVQKQPQVVKMASEYMRTITGGRYSLMTSAVDRKIYLSENETLSHKESRQWSSGLADQAYVAIRLAVSANFNGRAGLMPVVLDDVHLRFDPPRQRNLMKVLLEHSRKQQILFFSCDPGFTEMLSSWKMDDADVAPRIFRVGDGKIIDMSSETL